MASSPASPLWISNNHSGNTTVYTGSGQPFPATNPLAVQIPASMVGNPMSAPTGQVFNATSEFVLAGGQPATFLFASEDGTISGWNSSAGVTAVVMIDNSPSGAVYKALALGGNSLGALLYAANFHAGTIDVFNGNFSPVTLDGVFADPNLPVGFAPFNIQAIGDHLYVTYALQDDEQHDDVPGPGNGFVNVFDFNGNLLQRVVSQGNLNSPWGISMAPAQFGDFSSALLIGNFGDGTINAYDPASGEYLGTLQDSTGATIAIAGLWAIRVGNGGLGGDLDTVYFTAGIAGAEDVEDHGLLGSIRVAEPASPPQMTSPVQIANFSFAPVKLEVATGTEVTWTNRQNVEHDVTADNNQYFSETLGVNQSYSHTYSTPGTYTYHCSIHPFMKATVVVH
jgi:uncharacterized protein (TIGR03118 family)